MQRLSLTNSPSRMPATAGGKAERTLGSRTEEGQGREEVEEANREKLRPAGCRGERCVHLIPCVLLLCILVLYLFSYEPLQKEAATIGDLGRFRDRWNKDFLEAINGHRSLQQAPKDAMANHQFLRYRKFAVF